MDAGPRATPELEAVLRLPELVALRRACGPIESHIVGGTVRDALLGRPVDDLDTTVERSGKAVAERLAADLGSRVVAIGGERFAAYRIVGAHTTVDLWDRHGTPLDEELARRDLTVNALAVDLETGAVIDRHRGLDDLAERCLRAVRPTAFAEDPLRVLRLARLRSQLPDFHAAPSTVELAHDDAALLNGVATERIREEIRRLLAAPDAAAGVALLGRLGLYPGLWTARPSTGGAERAAETLRRLDELSRQAPDGSIDRALARQAVVLTVAVQEGKHPRQGGDGPLDETLDYQAAIDAAASAGRVTRRDARRLRRLPIGDTPPTAGIELRRFIHRSGGDWRTALAASAAVARLSAEQFRAIVALALPLAPALVDLRPLVDGRELAKALDIEPGPELGRLIEAIVREQVDGRLFDRETALTFAAGQVRRTVRGAASGEPTWRSSDAD